MTTMRHADDATLAYARQMIDNGRFDVARRSLSPFADDARARALLIELDEIERTGRLPHASDLASATPGRAFQHVVPDRTLDAALARLQTLHQPPRRIAPRWQRRFVVEIIHQNDDRAELVVKSLAAARYEWRYVPARALIRLEHTDDGLRITGRVRSRRVFVAAAVLGVMAALIAAVYVLALNVTLACATSMVLMIGGFYLLPLLMTHAHGVASDLAQHIATHLLAPDAAPPSTPPMLPHTATLTTTPEAARQQLLQLHHQRNAPDAVDWLHRLHLQHEDHADGLRFRLRALPLQFWDWWWTPPDIAGRLTPTDAGLTLHLAENRRTDSLFLLIGIVLLVVGVAATVVSAPVWARVVVVTGVVLALALSYPIAQASMAARNAQLAAFVRQQLE
jgi:hypothetical protein